VADVMSQATDAALDRSSVLRYIEDEYKSRGTLAGAECSVARKAFDFLTFNKEGSALLLKSSVAMKAIADLVKCKEQRAQMLIQHTVADVVVQLRAVPPHADHPFMDVLLQVMKVFVDPVTDVDVGRGLGMARVIISTAVLWPALFSTLCEREPLVIETVGLRISPYAPPHWAK